MGQRYLHLLTQPPEMTVKRKWERWVRKIIHIAAENGGWKLIRKDLNTLKSLYRLETFLSISLCSVMI